MSKQNKGELLFNSLKSLIYLLGSEPTNYVHFMQPMLVSYPSYISSLDGDIRKVSNILTCNDTNT